MKLTQTFDELNKKFKILGHFNLDDLSEDYEISKSSIKKFCASIYKESYEPEERIVFSISKDWYEKTAVGSRLECLQQILNEIDISNFFVIILTTNPDWVDESKSLLSISSDKVSINFISVEGSFQKMSGKKSRYAGYRYGSPEPVKISFNDLNEREKFLLKDSKVFCIYPWIHIHAYPTGEAYPCCHAEMHNGVIGNCRKKTLAEIWQDTPLQKLRDDMLNERQNPACVGCYEQERSGFFSGRQSANKHHGHQIKKLESNPFELTYWDIRFSNLCNLRCRSCGHIFSSQWYQDQAALAGPEWKKQNKVLNYAGRTEMDMWEQLLPHLDYVEQIYFAGGEPLLMEEHYNILDELDRRGMYHVRLIYNTNFTHTNLKDKSVFEYWKKFDSVAIGASLDALGPRAEYIRKGTIWSDVEKNRRQMLEICPNVDFYISPTLSIMNAWHIPDFHKDWVNQGLIRPQDLNVNILQGPEHYRIDIAPKSYKEKLIKRFQEHLEWLRSNDPLQRATVGFESAINFLQATDNSHLLDKFWKKTHELDNIRKEDILQVIPELAELR